MIGYAIPRPRLGVMLEVPSMVFMLPQLANRVDFISVGTNDLTQYILAVDRNNTRDASMYDILHPGVLRAIITSAHSTPGCWLSYILDSRVFFRSTPRMYWVRPLVPTEIKSTRITR